MLSPTTSAVSPSASAYEAPVHPDAKPLDPEAVLAALARHGVRAVIIGSLAAAMQGVDLPLTDIDLVPELSEGNVRALVGALEELGIDSERGVSPAVVAFMDQMPGFIRSSDMWTVLTERGEVDITLRLDGFPNGYDDLVDQEVARGTGSGILLASLDDIRRSKEIAGRDKDVEALRKFPRHPDGAPRPLPPRPPAEEAALAARVGARRAGLVLKPTVDRRTGRQVMRWMRP